MSGLFSSPEAQAQQAAQAEAQLNQQELNQILGYAGTSSTNEQNAAANAAPNPYFGAAGMLKPNAYIVDPTQTNVFRVSGPPGTSQGNPSVNGNNPFFTPSPGQMNPFTLQPMTRQTQPVAQRAPSGATS